MPELFRILSALPDALNSTGSVMIWNSTANENIRIPRLINNVDISPLINNPIMISGHEIPDPKFATGTSAPRIVSGT
jgi:hypothetical protein